MQKGRQYNVDWEDSRAKFKPFSISGLLRYLDAAVSETCKPQTVMISGNREGRLGMGDESHILQHRYQWAFVKMWGTHQRIKARLASLLLSEDPVFGIRSTLHHCSLVNCWHL